MENPTPSNVALAVNRVAAPRKRLDAGPAFRSLEDKYAVAIYVTHTGSAIVGYRGTGKVLFSEGDYAKAKGGKSPRRRRGRPDDPLHHRAAVLGQYPHAHAGSRSRTG